MFCLAFQILQYARLHLPKLGFFRFFLAAPKPHLTLRMGVVSVWAINLSKIWKWRGRSWGKTTMNCVENCGYNNLSLSRIVARVFSLKSTYPNMWVMWVYIVCVETWCIRCEKLAKRLFREYLTGRPYSWDTRKNQLSPFVMSLRIPIMCWAHASLHWKASRELPGKNSLLFTLPWVFTLFLTHNPYKEIPHKIQGT